ncbi:hypothetical protein Cadr_000023986 [Camelus dromedarius]|uniref:Uncharacterized protein n=1 Tax=Camelus dromedarius TaxID=9838 RepID=A0A5N4CW04_CAMDR|nr:hypothetical protein Cadr_000023986 [Camelus dromedarius]
MVLAGKEWPCLGDWRGSRTEPPSPSLLPTEGL